MLRITSFIALLLAIGMPFLEAQSPDPNSVPVIDGGIGTCSADFVITDNAGAPIYAATIQVHIAYGFLNAHKLDLQVGTNAAGKARFTGLPEKANWGFSFTPLKGRGKARPLTILARPAKRASPSLSSRSRNNPPAARKPPAAT